MAKLVPQAHPHLYERAAPGALASVLSLTMLAVLPWQAALVVVTLIWLAVWRLLQRLPPVAALMGAMVRVRDAIARRVLAHPEDAPYVSTVFGLGLVVALGLGASLWYQISVVGVLEGKPVNWVAVFVYHALWLGPNHLFFAHVTTLMHHHGHHRRIFRPRFRALDVFLVYVLGTLYGHVPENFSVGHVRNHHRYDNGPEDVLTTQFLDRSRFSSWLRYRTQFLLYWSGASVVDFFRLRGRKDLARRQLGGMVWFYGVGLTLGLLHPGLTLAYYLLPHIFVMNFLSAVNFMWHGFIDPEQPASPYANSLTILGATQDVWNEAYHVSHHDRPQARWVDMPDHYESRRDQYVARRALVFKDTQVFELFILLMMGKLGEIADRAFIEGEDLSREELIAELQRRLRPVPTLAAASGSPAQAQTSAAQAAR